LNAISDSLPVSANSEGLENDFGHFRVRPQRST
jgi:hypothetical protein